MLLCILIQKVMKSKGWKTNVVAFISFGVGLGIFGLYMFDKIGTEKFTLAIATLGTLTAMITARLAKDQTGTHTKK